MYTTYIIKSVNHNWYYVGLTASLEDRLKRHNSGREKTTKYYLPFKLVYTKTFKTRKKAREYEKFLKIRSNKEKIIKSARVAEW